MKDATERKRMAETLPRASLSPGTLPAEELLALCRRSVEPFFDAQPVAGGAKPQVAPRIDEYHLGKSVFIDTEFAAQTFTRNETWLRRHHDSDHLLLQLFVRGQNWVVNGRQQFTEDRANVYAVNLAFRIEAQSTDSRVLLLVLPRELVKEAVPRLAQKCGAVFPFNGAGVGIFSDHLLSLANHLGHALATEAPEILAATLSLLDALSSRDEAHAGPALHAGFRAACRFIDRNLGEPTLSTKSICQYLRCSRATVFRIFKPQGGVREYIQRRRLRACFDALTSPAQAHRQISDIAQAFGFHSASHFSHLFRAHFGIAPRDAREAGLRAMAPSRAPEPPVELLQSGADRNDEAERMWQWARGLTSQGHQGLSRGSEVRPYQANLVTGAAEPGSVS
jgi:AraC-like DNA-binding protein